MFRANVIHKDKNLSAILAEKKWFENNDFDCKNCSQTRNSTETLLYKDNMPFLQKTLNTIESR